jgi:hypothetical protein
MEVISWVSAHAGQNCELCLSAHRRLPGTLRYVAYIHISILVELLSPRYIHNHDYIYIYPLVVGYLTQQ